MDCFLPTNNIKLPARKVLFYFHRNGYVYGLGYRDKRKENGSGEKGRTQIKLGAKYLIDYSLFFLARKKKHRAYQEFNMISHTYEVVFVNIILQLLHDFWFNRRQFASSGFVVSSSFHSKYKINVDKQQQTSRLNKNDKKADIFRFYYDNIMTLSALIIYYVDCERRRRHMVCVKGLIWNCAFIISHQTQTARHIYLLIDFSCHRYKPAAATTTTTNPNEWTFCFYEINLIYFKLYHIFYRLWSIGIDK